MSERTPTPWEMPRGPYRNDGDDGPNFSGGDWEISPPLGESGPVAIACSEGNAEFIVLACNCHDELFAAAKGLDDFAWSAVTTDCEEARVYLQSLIDALRAAIAKAEGRS